MDGSFISTKSAMSDLRQGLDLVLSQLQSIPSVQLAYHEFETLTATIDLALRDFKPWQVCCLSLFAVLLVLKSIQLLKNLLGSVHAAGGVVPSVVGFVTSLPYVRTIVKKEKMKIRQKIADAKKAPSYEPYHAIPDQGLPAEAVTKMLKERKEGDSQLHGHGDSRLSGCVYIGQPKHRDLVDTAFHMYSITNPIHGDQFPSVVSMESEVIAMTASLVGGGPQTTVCGSMTSGGTESILMAMKASRDWARTNRGVTQPEIIIAQSGHAAYWKASEYFGMKLIVLPVGKDMRLSGSAVRRAMTRNTAVVVASAPCYPHGVVDHVQDIAKVCKRAGVCLHVDACLGGFVLAAARHLNRGIPDWDFRVPGVTSMSIDTHKYGLAHKGSSVVLYHHPDLRQHQYTAITTWTGGLYISPSMAGSRPGGLIASAWASLVCVGKSGYERLAEELLDMADRLVAGVKSIPQLQLVAVPDSCLVSFKVADAYTKQLNIYKVKDLCSKKGWYLSALQNPPAHIGGQPDVVDLLLADLKEAVQQLLDQPDCVEGGSAPMYGMANIMPDKRLVADFLTMYQDVMLEVPQSCK